MPMQEYANSYESATQPLCYHDQSLVQRGDVVLYLCEQDGRITNACMARVWDTIYYQDGSPIGVVLVDAESPKNTLPELETFSITNEKGETEKYFRGKMTVSQDKIPMQLCPLFRMGIYMKLWNKEYNRISVVPQPPHDAYPEPEDIYEDFFQKSVLKQAKEQNPYCLFTAGLWQRNNYYPHRALEFFRAAAKLNFSAAWLELGLAYDGSDLLERNPTKAAACYSQAAELSNPLAAYHLALCYINGKGVEQSDELAIQFLQTAIDGQILPAYLTLALYYRTGSFNSLRPKNSPYRTRLPVEPKPKHAFKLLSRASEYNWSGLPLTKFYLAECYRTGKGIRPDHKMAIELYKDAVEMGDIMIEEIQLACFYTGNTTRLTLAVDNGSAHAAYLLGRMFWNGENTDKDRRNGKRYLKIASESAHTCAELANQLLQQKEDLNWAFKSH